MVIEWIIIYDSEVIDDRILEYEKNIEIRLYSVKSVDGDSTASRQRNLGIEKATGDYLYFLDDDNIIYNNIFNKIRNYLNGESIVIVNQYDSNYKDYRFSVLHDDNMYLIDTAQIVVPIKYRNIKWCNEEKYYDERPYIRRLLSESGNNYIWVSVGYSYYNYLRRFNRK